MKNLEVAETHIEVLHTAVEDWTNLTESDRQRLGRYHTRDDVVATLNSRKVSLQALRVEINCVEYEIAMIQCQMESISEQICRAKKP